MNKEPAHGSCYPAGYSSSSIIGSFDFNTCSNLYSRVLNNTYQLKDKPILVTDQQEIIPIISEQQKFVAFGSVYYAFKFFTPPPTLSQITQAPNRKMLENSINSICATTWQALQEKYPGNAYLANECANGIYIDQLLFNKNGLLLEDTQLQITNTINQQPIDWPMGALLYQLTTKSSSTAFAN